MSHKHSPNAKHRPASTKKRRIAKAREREQPLPGRPSVFQHGRFGAIPLLPYTWTDHAGREHSGLEYDLSYAPPLPPGAVRGNVRRQQFCPICHVPRYFFVDQPRTCLQCGAGFVFGAAEQKYWYETLKFHFDSVATRCPQCRRARRSQTVAQEVLVAARAQVKARPLDAGVHLALAEAVVRYFQRHKVGPLKDAIAASRKARRLARTHPAGDVGEALFWEGMAQALSARTELAREALNGFLSAAPRGPRMTALAKEARDCLATL